MPTNPTIDDPKDRATKAVPEGGPPGRRRRWGRDIVAGARSLAAFVLPALAGNLVLACAPAIGRRRARNANVWLLGRLGPRLAGFSVAASGALDALALRPAVVVFNHQSAIDPVVAARLVGRDSIGLAKRALRRHPLLGPLLRMQGAVFIAADGGNAPALERAAARIRGQRLAVLVAPEGRRSAALQRFRAGAIRLAEAAGAPLVPVVIHNSGDILAPFSLLMRAGVVRVRVLAPRPPGSLDADELRALFRDALAGPAG